MKTLVIAANTRTAESVMKFHALREWKGYLGPEVRDAPFKDFEALPATSAYRRLLGDRPERIIIASDYLRWYFTEPGRMTNLWRMIETSRLRGARVVWS